MIERQIRQGDVLLSPVDVRPPDDAERKPQAVLAWGEISGHAHRLTGDIMEWTDDNGFRYVHAIGETATLGHEDHDPIPAAVVPPGQTFRVIQQKEWTLEGQWTEVRD